MYPSIQIYINRINKLIFKIKDGYKIELETPETTKLFGSKKTNKTENREHVRSLEVVKVALVQNNLIDNQFNKSLRYFMPICEMLNQTI